MSGILISAKSGKRTKPAGKKQTQKKQTQKKPDIPALAGKTVAFAQDDHAVYGRVKSHDGDFSVVDIALADAKGVLHCTNSLVTVKTSSFDVDSKALMSDETRQVKVWESSFGFRFPDGKSPMPIHMGADGDGPIVDYQNVKFEGFLSTFLGTTPADRDGDYVEPSAFNETLLAFKRNPAMLTDHQNSVHAMAGSFTKIGINNMGLAVEGTLSNRPGMKDTRFLIAEGHLKSLSMGGLFWYKEDGRGIEKVDLWEGSLTPVPANQDALFQVRSLTVIDAVKAMKHLYFQR